MIAPGENEAKKVDIKNDDFIGKMMIIFIL